MSIDTSQFLPDIVTKHGPLTSGGKFLFTTEVDRLPVSTFTELAANSYYKIHVFKGASTHMYLQSGGGGNIGTNPESQQIKSVYNR